MKKEFNLGTVKTTNFDQYVVVGLSNKWLQANNGKQLEFDAKLTLDGELVLVAQLEKLATKTQEVIENIM